MATIGGTNAQNVFVTVSELVVQAAIIIRTTMAAMAIAPPIILPFLLFLSRD